MHFSLPVGRMRACLSVSQPLRLLGRTKKRPRERSFRTMQGRGKCDCATQRRHLHPAAETNATEAKGGRAGCAGDRNRAICREPTTDTDVCRRRAGAGHSHPRPATTPPQNRRSSPQAAGGPGISQSCAWRHYILILTRNGCLTALGRKPYALRVLLPEQPHDAGRYGATLWPMSPTMIARRSN
jgi:hypothetical protein